MFKANHSYYGSDLNRLGVTHFHTCPYMSLLNGELFEGPFPPNHWIISVTRMITYLWTTHSANGPWDKSLKFIFPTKHVIPETLKSSHWLSETITPEPNKSPTDFGGYPPKGTLAKSLKLSCPSPVRKRIETWELSLTFVQQNEIVVPNCYLIFLEPVCRERHANYISYTYI